MWSSRLFWKLLAAFLALNLGLLLVALPLLIAAERERAETASSEELRSAVAVLQSLLREHPRATADQLQRAVQRIADRTRLRVTVLGGDGAVLAVAPSEGADRRSQLERPEIVEAASKGLGTSVRVQPVSGQKTLFYAARVDGPDESARFVRASLALPGGGGVLGRWRWTIWGVVVGIAALTTGVTYLAAVRIRRPLRTMTDAALAISAGDFDQPLDITGNDELGEMAEALNRVRRELGTSIGRLRQSSDRLETVLRGMAEGVIAVDAQQRILLVNEAARRFLRLDPTNLVGRPLIEAIRNNTLYEAAQAVLLSEVTKEVEFSLDAETARRVTAIATRLPGEPCPGVVLVLRDMTRLKQLENMRRDFVANVSHELKTPLATIKALAETLTHGAINDTEHNVTFVRRIEEQADRLHQLILDLLSLARIESGRSAFDVEDVPISSVVADCLAGRNPAAQEKNVVLRVSESDIAQRVRADAEALRQILDNLVSNAINYTPAGGSVTIAWRQQNGLVELSVTDTGIGIDPSNHQRVFERFYRVDAARSRELGGTGLGLAIVKHLAESFGGSVSVESQIGSGATFRVRLPRA
ncbi:MAG: ATP-binding protein [Pirellulales bacterium]|nr:HAMP domain-containing protein [Planctomycetales bacterium]